MFCPTPLTGAPHDQINHYADPGLDPEGQEGGGQETPSPFLTPKMQK